MVAKIWSLTQSENDSSTVCTV